MSEITTERILVFLDAITKRPESITDFAWVSYCRAICKRLKSEEMLKSILIIAKSIQDGFTEKPMVTVTQGQLNKWVDRIWDKCRYEGGFGDEDLISMLTEFGVRVER